MKSIIMAIVFLAISLASWSQQSKTIIGILPFRSTFTTQTAYTRQVAELVTQAFISTGRFSLFDEERLGQLVVDNNLSSSLLNETTAAGFSKIAQTAGIRYLISGDLKLLETKLTTNILGNNAYTAHVIFSVQIVDANTGEMSQSKIFDSYAALGGYVNMSYDTEHNAVIKTIQLSRKPLENFISENFPMTFSITSIVEEKNNEALRVEVLGGKTHGIEKNQKLIVYAVETRIIKEKKYLKLKEIGSVKITEVQGEDISEGKVLTGGKEILTMFKADQGSLQCQTR